MIPKTDFTHSLVTLKKHHYIYRIYYWFISFSIIYRIKRFFKYAVLGLIGTLVDVGLIYTFVNTLNLYYIIVTFFSDFIKTFVNYNLHKKFVFKDESKTFSKKNLFSFTRYYIINFSTVIFIFIMVIGLVEFAKFPAIFAKLTADLVMNLTRFSAHKSMVFKRPSKLGKL